MTYLDTTASLDNRVADLMERLTLAEKVTLLAGASSFALHGVERLGIPSLQMSDGPTGVRSIKGEPATVFPVGVAVAATWNPQTARDVAAAIGREAHALGEHVVLAPTINMMRIPTWGRNFETYSEDPYLAGVMGVAFVQALQGEGIGASLKHYAANNQELERFNVDARVDARALREIYLAAFERAEGRASKRAALGQRRDGPGDARPGEMVRRQAGGGGVGGRGQGGPDRGQCAPGGAIDRAVRTDGRGAATSGGVANAAPQGHRV